MEAAGRKDGQDLVAQIKDQGYDFVTTPEGLKIRPPASSGVAFLLKPLRITWIAMHPRNLVWQK